MDREKSDIEKFKELFASFGIECKSIKLSGQRQGICFEVEGSLPSEESTFSEKIDGYPSFYSMFYFDGNGKFVNIEIGE